MALIRHAQAREIARDAIVLDLGDVQQQAAQLMEQARRRAEEIVAEANAERARLLAGAEEEGRAEGTAKGLAEGRAKGEEQGKGAALAEWKKKLEELDARWTAAVGGVEAQRDAMLTEARTDVLRLALMIAEKVVKRAIAVDPGVVVSQLEAVLGLIARPTELLVAINPEDRRTAEQALPSLLAKFQSVRHVELVEDAGLARGSCVARTRGGSGDGNGAGHGGGGEVDASIEAQLARIAEILLPGGETGGEDEEAAG